MLTLSPRYHKTPLSGIIIIEHTFSVLTTSLALLKVRTITFGGIGTSVGQLLSFDSVISPTIDNLSAGYLFVCNCLIT